MNGREKLLRAEADVYRKALINLWGDATSGNRKTMDKTDVDRITSAAINTGNELSRRAKAAPDDLEPIGNVQDAGGGEVRLRVFRELDNYPPLGDTLYRKTA